jgi:hypothetical protein
VARADDPAQGSAGLAAIPAVDEATRPGAPAAHRTAMGERLGGFIYGTIVVLSVIVGGARGFPDEPGHIAAIAAATSLIFWLAHVYAHALGHSVSHAEHLTAAELGRIARHEAAIVEAAVPPIVALLLGSVGLISEHTALWLAFGAGMVVLVRQGLVFARVERLGWFATMLVVTANIGLGLLLVGLKLAVSH